MVPTKTLHLTAMRSAKTKMQEASRARVRFPAYGRRERRECGGSHSHIAWKKGQRTSVAADQTMARAKHAKTTGIWALGKTRRIGRTGQPNSAQWQAKTDRSAEAVQGNTARCEFVRCHAVLTNLETSKNLDKIMIWATSWPRLWLSLHFYFTSDTCETYTHSFF